MIARTRPFWTLSAAMLGISVIAQQPAYSLRSIVRTGSAIGGHTFAEDTAFQSPALNDAGDVAFISRWTTGSEVHAAVFTSRRIVAREGDIVDGKYLAVIPDGGRVAINSAGLVAFEAALSASKSEAEAGNAEYVIVAGNRVAQTRPFTAVGSFFSLGDDGRIALTEKAQAAPVVTPPTKRPSPYEWVQRGVRGLPPAIRGIAGQAQNAPAKALTATSCPLPPFPLPRDWSSAGKAIDSHRIDRPVRARAFTTPDITVAAASRNIYYGADCLPLAVAIGEGSSNRIAAVYASAGLLIAPDRDGSFEFRDATGVVKATTDAFSGNNTPLLLNHRGQALIPVTLQGGAALLLATPATR